LSGHNLLSSEADMDKGNQAPSRAPAVPRSRVSEAQQIKSQQPG